MTENDVLPFAGNILKRQMVFQLLADHNKTNIFPNEYNNLIAGAESNLVNWLEFLTEPGACQSEGKKVVRNFDRDAYRLFLFQNTN